jgi:hypothetical protein
MFVLSSSCSSAAVRLRRRLGVSGLTVNTSGIGFAACSPPADCRAWEESSHRPERQLRRRWEAAIGLTPKILQRMLRYQGFPACLTCEPSGSPAGRCASADRGLTR